jgi:NADH:ubiquinone oxidoreductase subunit 2 (subunit N)
MAREQVRRHQYYLVVIRQMYVVAPEEPGRFRVPVMLWGTVAVLMVGIFFIGIWPTLLHKAATPSPAPPPRCGRGVFRFG